MITSFNNLIKNYRQFENTKKGSEQLLNGSSNKRNRKWIYGCFAAHIQSCTAYSEPGISRSESEVIQYGYRITSTGSRLARGYEYTALPDGPVSETDFLDCLMLIN
jgi:hypothetical protein